MGAGGGGVQIAAPAKYFHQGKKNLSPPFFGTSYVIFLPTVGPLSESNWLLAVSFEISDVKTLIIFFLS